MIRRPPRSTLFPYTDALPILFALALQPLIHRALQIAKGGFRVGQERFARVVAAQAVAQDRKSTRLNSSHSSISYAVFGLKKKNKNYYKSILRYQSRIDIVIGL